MKKYNLEKKIEEYCEELFVDLGLLDMSEEKKAEIYARVEDHLQKIILETLTPALAQEVLAKINLAFEQENYKMLEDALKKHSKIREALEEKIETELRILKTTIAEEQQHARI